MDIWHLSTVSKFILHQLGLVVLQGEDFVRIWWKCQIPAQKIYLCLVDWIHWKITLCSTIQWNHKNHRIFFVNIYFHESSGQTCLPSSWQNWTSIKWTKIKIWDGFRCKICFFVSFQKIKSKAVLKSAMGGAELPYYDPWML